MREWLRSIRKSKEMTVDAVLEKTSISRQYYNMIENGTRNPSVAVAKSIAKLLNFDWTKFYDKNIESEESETKELDLHEPDLQTPMKTQQLKTD